MNTLVIALVVVETVILLVLSVLVAGLLRSYATVLQRLHQLDGGVEGSGEAAVTRPPPFRTAAGVLPPTGADRPSAAARSHHEEWAPAHDLDGQGLSGEIVSVRTVEVQHDTVIVFLSSGCTGCVEFWADLADRSGPLTAGTGRLVVVTKSADQESVGRLRELCPPGLDLIMSSRAWEEYQVPGSPYVIVVDGTSGRVKGEGSGTSLNQISGLMRQAYSDGAPMVAGRSVVKPRSDSEREVDVDRTLLAAGIGPGHPSLYPQVDR